MVNILPQDSLKTVRHFYRSRAIVAASLVASACGVVALLVLVSAYMIVNAVPASLEGSPEVTLPTSSGNDREEIVRAQILLKEFEPIASSASSSTAFIEAALSARPPGVRVQNIHITRGDPGTMVLAGTALSRDDINAYRVSLSNDTHFKSVSVPIGILAGTKDDRFTVTLTGDF
ncbi:hypothetical protein A3B35_02335 [Candidatus Kaiserbacteria bacterium RIFCSPLOWO2_01_FULL_54_24]|uniref:Uncharacterized protein n=1 Tax=Candidatus Kaiserbacteria bacterium RIFCSPLOWO2_01_FULL_54_24 TaxID=1798515 RepID=A0A1F6EW76_9BACT|nr:MAG: hypothetical protein A3B35_02335 [Candidatus Kaiserbacteria bacterium RIFCSPLOWO2_01_FULL_54_24]